MARIKLPYGKSLVEIDVPEDNLAGILTGKHAPGQTIERAFEHAWKNPIGIENPAQLIRPGERVVFVVTDHTRSTPIREIFSLLWERIHTNVRPDDVVLIVATGTHRPPTKEELEAMFGDLLDKFRIEIHDCDNNLLQIGTSKRGTPILLNRHVVEADRVVTIGHIGTHYYAGYSGGRKNILPGVAGRETIEKNHAQLMDSGCEACVYQGNPISEEMSEAARMVGVDFIVDCILDGQGQVGRVVIGDVEEAHTVGRAFWDSLFRVTVSGCADLVVVSAGGHPKDIDLYQSYKALYNAGKAVRRGGMILLVAACPDGAGNDVFTDWAMRSKHPQDVVDIFAREGFKLGGHKALYLAKDLQRAEIYLLSEANHSFARRFFLQPVDSPAEVLNAARKRFGKDFRVLVIPHGAETFPVIGSPLSEE